MRCLRLAHGTHMPLEGCRSAPPKHCAEPVASVAPIVVESFSCAWSAGDPTPAAPHHQLIVSNCIHDSSCEANCLKIVAYCRQKKH